MSLVSWKLEEQLATTAHTLEWPESKTLTTPNADKDVGPQELSFIAAENAKCCSPLEDSLAVSYDTKHAHAL